MGRGKLRWEEWSNAITVSAVLLIRIGFVIGAGFAQGGAAKKRAREVPNLVMQKSGVRDFARDASRSGDAPPGQTKTPLRIDGMKNGCKPIIRLSSQWYPSGATSQSPF